MLFVKLLQRTHCIIELLSSYKVALTVHGSSTFILLFYCMPVNGSIMLFVWQTVGVELTVHGSSTFILLFNCMPVNGSYI
jgi:hypothetical protein